MIFNGQKGQDPQINPVIFPGQDSPGSNRLVQIGIIYIYTYYILYIVHYISYITYYI